MVDAIELLPNEVEPELQGTEKWYLELARNYRLLNQHSAALDIPLRAEAAALPLKNLVFERYQLHASSNQWREALVQADRLIAANPQNSRAYALRGRALKWLRRREEANSAFQHSIEVQHGVPLERVIPTINRGLRDRLQAPVTGEYVGSHGRNNLGGIRHHVQGQGDLFTKITRPTPANVREALHYEQNVRTVARLQSLSPGFVARQVIDGLQNLTLKSIPTDQVATELQALSVAAELAEINSDSLRDTNVLNPMAPVLTNRPISVSRFFNKFHESSALNNFLTQMDAVLNAHPYYGRIRRAAKTYTDLLIDVPVHLLIEPERHYSLTHYDFGPSNILHLVETGSTQLIDWGSASLSLRFSDMSYHWAYRDKSFEHVEGVLNTSEETQHLESVERLLILVKFVFQTVLHKGLQQEERVYDTVLQPELTTLRELTATVQEDARLVKHRSGASE